VESKTGVVRDPELSFDGQKVIFSMRKSKDDSYSLYEINIDGTGLKQLTFAPGVSDIDPLYLPDGGIVFSSTRQPKYCMCNRHIMANLYRMNADGSNITQIGVSTLFEGHASLMNDGRILYDRWEYVDRNFGDAQGLWTVNPDGTKAFRILREQYQIARWGYRWPADGQQRFSCCNFYSLS
jgi:tricorn protease-like protein